MSGNFQRPSLRTDTFKAPLERPKLGLKVAFETRTSLQASPFNNGDTFNQNLNNTFERSVTRSPNEHYELHPIRGSGREFERDSLTYYQQADERQIKPRLTPSGGLKAAFDKREQVAKMSANISRSVSSTSDHVPYENDEFIPDSDSIDISQHNEYGQSNLQSSYPLGYHSIHRLGTLNNRQGGNNLMKAFEARTGGTSRRNLRQNGQADTLLENHANLIVSKMEQDESLMEDSPDAEELRRTALRDMPQCLTLKRCVKVKLSKSVSQKSKRKPLSLYKTLKYRTSMSIAKFKIKIKDLFYSFELWYDPLKKIEGNFGTGVASFFKFLRWLFLVNLLSAILALAFIVIPKAVNSPSIYEAPSWTNALVDIFTGEGFMKNTLMYYGSYTDETLHPNRLPYSMSHAYFFTMVVIYLIALALVGISACKSYKRSFIETEGGLKNVFANKIFCGWDYNIATKDAAILKSNSIYNELKELISDYAWKNRKKSFSLRVQTFIVQFCMNILIILSICGTGYFIVYFLENVPKEGGTRILVTPVFINGVMTFLPMFLSYIVKYEDYKNPCVSLYLTLARTFVLGFVTIGALVGYWLSINSKSPCWETSLAQEMYRMIIFDFFISVLFVAIIELCLYGIYKLKKDTYLEFDIAWNTMQIIYNQTLFSVGLVVSPLLPVVVVIKLLLTWYIRQFTVLYLCKPSSRSWRAAQTTTWFLVMVLLSLLFIVGLLGYMITSIPVSKACGPFSNYEFVYEVVIKGVLQLTENSTNWATLLYITKPGVIALVLIGMAARVYYVRAKANAQKEIVEQCRNMLIWSAKDKEYYYSLISKVTKGQWQYNLHDKNVMPELYSPYLDNSNERGDIGGVSVSSNFLSSPSGLVDHPSTSTMAYNLEEDDQSYTQSKKYS